MIRAWPLPFLLAASLCACSQQGWIDRLSTAPERRQASAVIGQIRSVNVAALRQEATSDLAPKLETDIVAAVARLIPVAPATLQTVSVQSFVGATGARTTKFFNFEIGRDDRWAIVQIAFVQEAGQLRLDAFQVYPRNAQPTAANDFAVGSPTPTRVVWPIAMLLAIATSIAGIVVAFRGWRDVRRWCWIAASALPFVSFSLNWTTGEWAVRPFNFILLGAGAMRSSPFDPWILTFAVPIGAIVVFVRRARKDYW